MIAPNRQAPTISVAGRTIGVGHPMFVIAELSANHAQELDRAIEILQAAARSGADAVKLQTYTADSMTIDSEQDWFRIDSGTLWAGRNLYDLYGEAATPYEWFGPLSAEAERLGVVLFSSPFDRDAVDFLEAEGTPAYKIASFELVDLELIAYVAATGKPMIMSTGMATVDEIDEALRTARGAGSGEIALLRCNSAYPAPPEEMDLITIPDMIERWNVPVGLSDHTLSPFAVVASLGLGASILEKHVTLSRAEPTADSVFSLEPAELAEHVGAIRTTEAALGGVRYGPSSAERSSLRFRRSLFVVQDVRAGDALTAENVRAIRPGDGLAPRYLGDVTGRRARVDIARGTPLSWELIEDG